MARSRRPWHGNSSPTGPLRSTASWWTRGTGRHWRSAAPATGSVRPCGTGLGCGMANAPFRDAATIRSTTKPTTSSPGINAAPPGYRTWDNPAPNITAYGIPAAGNPPRPPKPHHPAGPHPPAGTTKANTRTGNHHTGQGNCHRNGKQARRSHNSARSSFRRPAGLCLHRAVPRRRRPGAIPPCPTRLTHGVSTCPTTGFRQAQPPGPGCPQPPGSRHAQPPGFDRLNHRVLACPNTGFRRAQPPGLTRQPPGPLMPKHRVSTGPTTVSG
jgi:hypothetical protein